MLKKHYFHIYQVWQYLKEAGLQADIHKCEFYIQEIKFFGLIISIKDI